MFQVKNHHVNSNALVNVYRDKSCTKIPPLLETEILSTNTVLVTLTKYFRNVRLAWDLNHYFYTVEVQMVVYNFYHKGFII